MDVRHSIGDPVTIALSAAGDRTVFALVDESGAEIAAVEISPEGAGALGGQLISGAHRPLPKPYTLTGAATFVRLEDVDEGDDGDATPSSVTPALLARRPHPRQERGGEATLAWSSSSPHDVDEVSWRFSKSAREHLDKHNVTEDEVFEVLENPDMIAPATYGNGTTFLRDGIGVLVPVDAPHLVIAVFRADPEPPVRRPSGGPGRRMPTGIDITTRKAEQ